MANETEALKADIVIIGVGIAGLLLALKASQHGLKPVMLDDGRKGTTYAATGIMAPRADYMFRDIDLVRRSDEACLQFQEIFPATIRPKRFLVPIDPTRKRMFRYMESLLRQYDEVAFRRRINLPASSKMSRLQLELEESSKYKKKNF